MLPHSTPLPDYDNRSCHFNSSPSCVQTLEVTVELLEALLGLKVRPHYLRQSILAKNREPNSISMYAT